MTRAARRLDRALEHVAAAFALPVIYAACLVLCRPVTTFVAVATLAACAAAVVVGVAP